MIDGPDYERLLAVIVENAQVIVSNDHSIRNDEDRLHRTLFDRVLNEVDQLDENLSRYEAADISDVCQEVEADILHGDILGI